MMNKESEQEMLSYYDERVREYDETYLGKGPAIRQHARGYKRDVVDVSKMVSRYGNGHLIDIACGTGFWIPYYAPNCLQITFLDQSDNMLSECRDRIAELGLTYVPHFIQGDFFAVELKTAAYDCALAGFLLSHLTSEREEIFFGRLKEILKPFGQLMIMDGFWSEIRQKYREKEGIQERVLNDGRRFRIYKRYFSTADVEEMFVRHQFTLKSVYAGEVFIAAIAECTD